MIKQINNMNEYDDVILVRMDDVSAELWLNKLENPVRLGNAHLYGIVESGDFSDIDDFSDVLLATDDELSVAHLNGHVKAVQGVLF